jgi:ABC-type glycerol-3-phosphate transport system substrate-binding protein
MPHIRPFEIGLIAFFGLAALAGILYLANVKGGGGDDAAPTYGAQVVIWGTFDAREIQRVFMELTKTDEAFRAVSYRQIDERSFVGEFVNAIADGSSPDLILIPHTLLVSLRTKLTAIGKETLDERTFRDTYIDGASIFMLGDGTYALPLAVDPLVLFWNRDLFSSAGLATPPTTWEALVSETTPRLTVIGSDRKVSQSAIGMGEFLNVNHAKDILALLLFQAGVTVAEERDGKYVITLSAGRDAESALRFYTQFASPASSAYTWTRSMQFDRNAFTGGKLAMYLGSGSEIPALEEENPNMNFDVAPVPQAQGATALRNYGTFYGFAIPKASRNVAGAYRVASKLTSGTVAGTLAEDLHLTPVLRSLYGGATNSVYDDVLRKSALIARGWLDPSPEDTEDAFRDIVSEVTSGRKEIDTVIGDAVYTLETLFR